MAACCVPLDRGNRYGGFGGPLNPVLLGGGCIPGTNFHCAMEGVTQHSEPGVEGPPVSLKFHISNTPAPEAAHFGLSRLCPFGSFELLDCVLPSLLLASGP